ncbi:hypothetical protein [Streptomyces fulvoviolaceus]|uniref:hypothetical protein n=1 Tax=Streptomyces fulvoviolaceus TaxID=285535 RepID=UPI0009981C8D|nr:hypothetical protein [Streptomyces fulvoviolaceus]
MLRATRSSATHGRRGALIGASAAVVCLGGVLAACAGGGGGDGYVATGSAGGPSRSSGTAVAPTGGVTLVPLDGTPSAADPPAADSPAADSPSAGGTSARLPESAPPPPGTSSGASPAADGAKSSRTPATSPSSTTPGGPAALTWAEPTREPADERWCEDVTLAFHNTGGSAVRSGTVTFGTHVIGALGIDWATVESEEKLPVPIGAGARRTKTWTVCVDAWRVPIGMHVETRDVTVEWE